MVSNITAKVLVCVGTQDPCIPVDQRLAFEPEIVEDSLGHPWADRASFPGLKYQRSSDERAWRAMIDLLDEVFE